MDIKTPGAARDTEVYRLDWAEVEKLNPSAWREWIAFLERSSSDSPMRHPHWLREFGADGKGRASACLPY